MNNSIIKYFEVIGDIWELWKVRHNMLEIIFMTSIATICRAETWQKIEAFAEEKEACFHKYLELESGISSYDMFERCLRLINPR